MRLIKWMIVFSCSMLLFGCFDNIEKKERDFKLQGEELVQNYLQYKLKNFVKLNPGADAYCVDGNCLTVFFDSKNIKYEKKDNKYVLLYRQYNLIKYYYEIDSIEYGSVTKKDDKFVSEITLKLKLQYEKLPNLPGVKIAMVPEECLSALAIKNESIEQFLSDNEQLLPSNSFCYKNHLTKTKNSAGLETTEKIYVVWDKNTKKWTYALAIDSNYGDMQFFDATAPQYSQEALENLLKENQFVLFRNSYFKQNDVENLKNLEKGLLKINGNWISAQEYWDSRDLKAALKKLQQGKISFYDFFMEMQKKTHAGKEVIDEIVAYLVPKMIEEIRMYKKDLNLQEIIKFKNNLIKLKQNEHLKVFCVPEIFDEIEQAEQYIAQENEKKLKERCKTELRSVLSMREMLLNILNNYLTVINSRSGQKTITGSEIDLLLNKDFFKISPDRELKLWIKEYTFLQILRMRDRVKYLERFDHDRDVQILRERFMAKCENCKDGILICKQCHGSKVCVVCHGRGYYNIEKIDGWHSVSCPPRCEYCKTPQKCYHCNGQNFKILNAQKLPNEIAEYRAKIKNRLESQITSLKQSIDEISAALKSDDVKEMQRVLLKQKSFK